MKVCHRCGDQKQTHECYEIVLSITERKSHTYVINQDFELCSKCKDILLDRLSTVLSDSQPWKPPKEVKKTEVESKPKKKKTKKK